MALFKRRSIAPMVRAFRALIRSRNAKGRGRRASRRPRLPRDQERGDERDEQ
jgi:hypothetical protein